MVRTTGPSATQWILCACFLFSFAQGILHLLLPLYAYSLGFSGVAIGSLISLPIVLQMAIRFIGGAAADRWGEKRILIVCCTMTAVMGVLFFLARSYGFLLVAQTANIVARSSFWVSGPSIVTRLPGNTSILLGRFNATNNLGLIAGGVGAGFFATNLGYSRTFLIVALAGVLAFMCILQIPGRVSPRPDGAFRILEHVAPVTRLRPIYFAMLCSFAGAFPHSLSQSFYPVYLATVGFASETIGPLISVKSVGSIVTALLLARIVSPERRLPLTVTVLLALAVCVGATPFTTHVLPLMLLLAGLGSGSTLMELYYQLIARDAAGGSNRSTAMAIGGLGWNFSHLVTPLVFGFLSDLFGLAAAFHLWAGFTVLLAANVPLLHRWAFTTRETPAEEGTGVPETKSFS